MSSVHPRLHLAEELLGHRYRAQAGSTHLKLSNERFDVLLQKSASVVLDHGGGAAAAGSGGGAAVNVYCSLDVAHAALLGAAACKEPTRRPADQDAL